METAALLKLIAFVISEAPAAISTVESIVSTIHTNYAKSEDKAAALQSILNILQPMEKIQ